MSSPTTIKNQLNAIIAKANAKTSKSDKTVDEAVDTLIAGFGKGDEPTGTIDITTNGTHDVKTFANANVSVPIPSEYIKPSGTKEITTNGTHDVRNFASATVNVQGGVTPSGTKTITSNGTHDVADCASVIVNVPSKVVVRTVTFNEDIVGESKTITILTNDDFIKEHYSHAKFSVLMYAVTPVASAANVMHMQYQGNANIGSSSVTRGGVFLRSSSASAVGLGAMANFVNGSGYSNSFRVASDGSLKQYLNSGNIWKAGTYNIVLTCAE